MPSIPHIYGSVESIRPSIVVFAICIHCGLNGFITLHQLWFSLHCNFIVAIDHSLYLEEPSLLITLLALISHITLITDIINISLFTMDDATPRLLTTYNNNIIV